ncbi:hypothetical protein SAMN05444505_108204 [Pseudomonas syringae]|uniref:AP2 domain-containing protein n=1 Tax=Pseudomonas syringae TaxID=317 RepID=A0AB37ZQD1_PSESX|nr:hypothetical protein SAMN05444505_108204 [Pseudomonas syringae]
MPISQHVVNYDRPRHEIAPSQNVASRKPRLVRGVGHNDASYPVYGYSNANGRQKRLWICPFYAAWKDMLERCYSEKFLNRYPTYRGCSVESSWLSLSVFSEWMSRQDHVGKHLDKDILSPGNKIYSAETCAFISPQLNNFLTNTSSIREGLPTGVSKTTIGRFSARCRNPFTGHDAHIGMFDNPESAHDAWRERKHFHACAYAELQSDHRVAQALRQRYQPINGGAA